MGTGIRPLPALVVLLALLTSAAFGNGWVGQEQVSGSDTSSGQPTIGFDLSGRPWVVWHGYWAGGSLQFSRWLGDRWDGWRRVGPDFPGELARFRPSLGFDERGQAWLAWHDRYANDADDISSSYWSDSCWSPGIQVNRPDSTDLDFAPSVSSGGGQVWCVWYGGPTDVSSYSVFASRWDSSAGAWGPETQVSPPDGNNHWWCDVAVDSEGTPHGVWTETEHVAIYYSFYNGLQWSAPVLVNDSSRVRAASWAAPRIVIDRDGVLHVCYTGVLVGTSRRDVFYTRNDGSGWTPSVRVTQDTAYDYHEWYSDIAADRPDNVWVVWDRQGEGPDQFRVYAVRFDGRLWSTEQRLDGDSSYYDGRPKVALDTFGFPWVVWDGIAYATGDFEVYCNRYGSAPVAEVVRRRSGPTAAALSLPSPVRDLHSVRCWLPVAGPATIAVYDASGRRVVVTELDAQTPGWLSVPVSERLTPGVHVCRLSASGRIAVQKFVIVGH